MGILYLSLCCVATGLNGPDFPVCEGRVSAHQLLQLQLLALCGSLCGWPHLPTHHPAGKIQTCQGDASFFLSSTFFEEKVRDPNNMIFRIHIHHSLYASMLSTPTMPAGNLALNSYIALISYHSDIQNNLLSLIERSEVKYGMIFYHIQDFLNVTNTHHSCKRL